MIDLLGQFVTVLEWDTQGNYNQFMAEVIGIDQETEQVYVADACGAWWVNLNNIVTPEH